MSFGGTEGIYSKLSCLYVDPHGKKILKIHLSHNRKAGYKSISHIDVAYWETVLTFSMDFVAKAQTLG